MASCSSITRVATSRIPRTALLTRQNFTTSTQGPKFFLSLPLSQIGTRKFLSCCFKFTLYIVIIYILLLRLAAVFRFIFLTQEFIFSYEFASDVQLILETFFSLRSQVFGANCGVPLALARYEQRQLSGHCHGQVPERRSTSAPTHEGREDSENAAECLACSLLLIDI